MPLPPCQTHWLGRIDYGQAWDLQRELVLRRGEGIIGDTLLLLEHPPVYTTGRRNGRRHLRTAVADLGAPLLEVDRGGDITFHGPGQLIAYPIIDLRAAGLGVVDYVRALEEVVIATLNDHGIEGGREPGLTGVWVDADKIAAIGVRVSQPQRTAGGRWVTSHGLALNVSVDLEWFERIVPCGIAGRGVTSMRRLLGRQFGLRAIAGHVAGHFGQLFGRRVEWGPGRLSKPSALFARPS